MAVILVVRMIISDMLVGHVGYSSGQNGHLRHVSGSRW